MHIQRNTCYHYYAYLFILYNLFNHHFLSYTHDDSNYTENILLQVPESNTSSKIILRNGEFTLVKNSPITIIMYHGFSCESIDTRIIANTLFPNYSILSFDFRAHGKNTKTQCCTFGKNEILEVKASVDFIRNNPQTKNKPIIGYGFSMGAVAAIEAQSHYKNLFDALILDSPFDSSENVIKRGIKQISYSILGYDITTPFKKILYKNIFNQKIQNALKAFLKLAHMDATKITTCFHKVEPLKSIENITIPMLIIGSKDDEKVPAYIFKQIFDAIQHTKKQLWISQGRNHFDSLFYNPKAYLHTVSSFLEKYILKDINEK